jgi:hypothetical protein
MIFELSVVVIIAKYSSFGEHTTCAASPASIVACLSFLRLFDGSLRLSSFKLAFPQLKMFQYWLNLCAAAGVLQSFV